MIKNRIFYCVALVAAAVFNIFYYGWYSGFLLLLVLCLPWFSLLLYMIGTKNTKIVAMMPASCAAGEEVPLKITVKNKGTMSYCVINVKKKLFPYGKTENIRRFILSDTAEEIKISTEHCGITVCDLAGSRSYDLLGLFCFKIKKCPTVEMLVEASPCHPDKMPNLNKAYAANRVAKRGGVAEEYDLRDYREGDSLRMIHWKASAKTDGLVAKEALEPLKMKAVIEPVFSKNEDENDSVLGQLIWLSDELFGHGAEIEIVYTDSEKLKRRIADISNGSDFLKALRTVLLTASTDANVQAVTEAADLYYRITPKKEVRCGK
ncbi:MAG: DUF58 domain-containing protein [Clostridia bacterium]|nr:DUF58 domain-containing protein [Clostridia bacterium]